MSVCATVTELAEEHTVLALISLQLRISVWVEG